MIIRNDLRAIDVFELNLPFKAMMAERRAYREYFLERINRKRLAAAQHPPAVTNPPESPAGDKPE